MFKPKKEDKNIQKMREEIEKKAQKAQQDYNRRKQQASKLLDKDYVQQQLGIEKAKDMEIERRQSQLIGKTMNQIKKTELHAFECKLCGSPVDMQNLTCSKCGQLYCQFCGAAFDMENPGLCPRCQRPPMFTPAELVITKVEDLPPEDRFWEELPLCPKCGAAVQPDWNECPICNGKLTPTASGSSVADSGEWEEGVDSVPDMETESDKKKDKKKRSGM
jgi:hypothetical protein